eukprot:g3343.t1
MAEPNTVTEAHSTNNAKPAGHSRGGHTKMVLDLASLQQKLEFGYRSNRQGQSSRLYHSLSNVEKRAIKILDDNLVSPEQGRAYSEEYIKNMNMVIKRSQESSDKLTIVKTITTNGCILFSIELIYLGDTTLEQDVFIMVNCLPTHLQSKRMIVVFPSYDALVVGKLLVCITLKQVDKGVRTLMWNNQTTASEIKPTEVELIEPPCLSTNDDKSVTVYTHTTDDKSTKQSIVATVGSKVVQETKINSDTHFTKLDIPKSNGSPSVSVRFVKHDPHNRPIVGASANILILPEASAKEFNSMYEQMVMRASIECQKPKDSIEIRSAIWSKIMKPLQDDIDFILSEDLTEVRQKTNKSKQARESYNRLIQKIFKFFVEEEMWNSLSYFRLRFGGMGLFHEDGQIDDHLLTSLYADHLFAQKADLNEKKVSSSLRESRDRPIMCSLLKTEELLSYRYKTTQVLSMV